jgi:membrane protease YdiL (CAAX protease family)
VITNEPSTQQQTPLSTETAGPVVPLEQQFPESGVHVVTSRGENPWATWLDLLKAFGVWVASIILLLATQVAVAIPYFAYVWVTTGRLPQIETLTSDKILAFISIASVLPAHLLTLGLIWLVITQGRKVPFWPAIKWHWPNEFPPAIGTLICVVIAIFLFVIGAAATYFWGGNRTQLDALVESSIAARMATAFIAVFTAPLVEELIYRGVLYSALQRAVGTAITVGIVSLLFAGVHVFQYIDNLAVIAVITMLSFTLTLVRAYSGSVLAPFVIHLVFNAIQSVIIALSPFTGWGQST